MISIPGSFFEHMTCSVVESGTALRFLIREDSGDVTERWKNNTMEFKTLSNNALFSLFYSPRSSYGSKKLNKVSFSLITSFVEVIFSTLFMIGPRLRFSS